MTIPALPADDTVGSVWSAAKVNAVYDLLQLFRDTRPTLIMAGSLAQSVTSGSPGIVEYSDGAGNFATVPVVNTGGFTASGVNGDVLVPEIGLYLIRVHANALSASATGETSLHLRVGGNSHTGTRVALPNSGATPALNAWGVVHIAAVNTPVGAVINQISGATVTYDTYIDAVWLAS